MKIISNGIAKNKKESKRVAMRGIMNKLIENNLIVLGLTSKNFQAEGNDGKDSKDSSNDQKLSQQQNNVDINLEEMTPSNLLKLLIKNLESEEAITYLELINNKKDILEWPDICHLWCYALSKNNESLIKEILNIIMYNKNEKNNSNNNNNNNWNNNNNNNWNNNNYSINYNNDYNNNNLNNNNNNYNNWNNCLDNQNPWNQLNQLVTNQVILN
jgi:hypothetical protein